MARSLIPRPASRSRLWGTRIAERRSCPRDRAQKPAHHLRAQCHLGGQVAVAVTVVPTGGSIGESTGVPDIVVLATTVPLAPVAPVAPAGPRAPAAPTGPCGPVSPVAPFAPAGPVAPAEPCGPGTPWTPCGPVEPWRPVGPCGPATVSGDDTYERMPMPRAPAASTTAMAIPPRINQSSFACLVTASRSWLARSRVSAGCLQGPPMSAVQPRRVPPSWRSLPSCSPRATRLHIS